MTTVKTPYGDVLVTVNHDEKLIVFTLGETCFGVRYPEQVPVDLSDDQVIAYVRTAVEQLNINMDVSRVLH